MTGAALITQLFAVAVAVLLAPLFLGWVNMCRAWLQNRGAPPITQPYRMIRKLLRKDAVIATDASALFVFAPYVIFGSMVTAAAIIPALALDLPFARAADAIALVGLFATARVFVALAAIDTGTTIEITIPSFGRRNAKAATPPSSRKISRQPTLVNCVTGLLLAVEPQAISRPSVAISPPSTVGK